MGILDMKPDFKAMNKLELRAYVLAHRDDEDAFHAYIDKLQSDDRRVKHPATESLEHLSNYPNFNRTNTNNS
jgi:hypothetical protein